MKAKSLITIALAGVFTCAGAYAGGFKHGSAHYDSSMHMTLEVTTPSSVNESAPWLAGKPHLAGWTAPAAPLSPAMNSQLSSTSDGAEPYYVVDVTEYWLIGEAPAEENPAIGSTSSSGSGFGRFDSSTENGRLEPMSRLSAPVSAHEIVVYTPAAEALYQAMGDDAPLMSEHYLVPIAASTSTPGSYLVLTIGPTAEDFALLDSLKQDFYVVTRSDIGG